VVGVADTGAAALELAQRAAPDLAVMDIQLRGPLDGVRTAVALRERFDIACVFLSAFTSDATIHQTQEATPFGYIFKPYDERMLHITVQSALYRRLAEHEQRAAERERRRADRAETSARLAASVVHEVNNLLSAIRCNAYVIGEHAAEHAVLHEAVQDISAAVARGEALMADLSGLARARRATPLAIELAALIKSTARHQASIPTEPPPAPSRAMLGRAGTRGSVLVVDDDTIVRRALTKFLEVWGCTVWVANTPSEALALIAREAIDVLLTDLVMPELSGYELAERATQLAPGIGVVYMSGHEPRELLARTGIHRLPQAAFLQKPFDVEALKRTLDQLLSRAAHGNDEPARTAGTTGTPDAPT
jgi:CheY-like chemotaxis protein